MHYVQELVYEDFDWGMEFYKLIEERGNDFENNVVFFDEARFELHENVNVNIDDTWNFVNSYLEKYLTRELTKKSFIVVLKRSRYQLQEYWIKRKEVSIKNFKVNSESSSIFALQIKYCRLMHLLKQLLYETFFSQMFSYFWIFFINFHRFEWFFCHSIIMFSSTKEIYSWHKNWLNYS